MNKLFTAPWIGVLLVILLLIFLEISIFYGGFKYGFSTSVITMFIIFTIILLFFVVSPIIFNEPIISTRTGIYISGFFIIGTIVTGLFGVFSGGLFILLVLGLSISYIYNQRFVPGNLQPPEYGVPSDEPSRNIPTEVVQAVWRRDRGKCVICGSRRQIEFDHIIPFSKGGSNTVNNIRILCKKCNRRKSDKIE